MNAKNYDYQLIITKKKQERNLKFGDIVVEFYGGGGESRDVGQEERPSVHLALCIFYLFFKFNLSQTSC
jgi:hypothetical protein